MPAMPGCQLCRETRETAIMPTSGLASTSDRPTTARFLESPEQRPLEKTKRPPTFGMARYRLVLERIRDVPKQQTELAVGMEIRAMAPHKFLLPTTKFQNGSPASLNFAPNPPNLSLASHRKVRPTLQPCIHQSSHASHSPSSPSPSALH